VNGRRVTALALSLLYGAAGVAHLAYPEPFMMILPAVVPWPREVVLLTGAAEILGAAALQSARLARAAGLMLALYALAVWPANWKHALDGAAIGWVPTSWWYHGPRLALQPLLIAAALYAGGWRAPRTGRAPV
jgi:uncharacterized membrane protein